MLELSASSDINGTQMFPPGSVNKWRVLSLLIFCMVLLCSGDSSFRSLMLTSVIGASSIASSARFAWGHLQHKTYAG